MEEQKTERTYKVVFSNLIQKLEEDKTTTKERVRLAHITEAKGTRVVTMAYKWYRDGRVEYGATIWRKSKPEESYRPNRQGILTLPSFSSLSCPCLPCTMLGSGPARRSAYLRLDASCMQAFRHAAVSVHRAR